MEYGSSIAVSSLPILGEIFLGISIIARDSDDLEIETDSGEDFAIVLNPPVESGELSIQCATAWDLTLKTYTAECSLPKLDQAGEWLAVASLGGIGFSERTIRMQCPPDEFEDKYTKCKGCPVGADCAAPGATLEHLPIKEGHWRSQPETTDVRRCPGSADGSACSGCGGAGCAVANFTGCKPGTEGPYCGLCAAANRSVYYDVDKMACLPCRAEGSATPLATRNCSRKAAC